MRSGNRTACGRHGGCRRLDQSAWRLRTWMARAVSGAVRPLRCRCRKPNRSRASARRLPDSDPALLRETRSRQPIEEGVVLVNRALIVILATVTLDAVGIGLALPVIPSLLRELSHETKIAGRFGYFMAIYPFMQFLFSPVLGRLSDRFGRRPSCWFRWPGRRWTT